MIYIYWNIVVIESDIGRNPCFSGQCFAMRFFQCFLNPSCCRNPCFSGQCFAIYDDLVDQGWEGGRRNPCFSGQCFAMIVKDFLEMQANFRRNPCFSGQCFAI